MIDPSIPPLKQRGSASQALAATKKALLTIDQERDV
jgi:hypothetical protein